MGPAVKIGLAFALDMAAEELPEGLHPVCWMGKAVTLAERAADGLADMAGPDGSRAARRLAGVVTAVGLPACTYLVSRGALKVAPPRFRGAAEVALLSTALACRSLGAAARGVETGLAGGLEEGRKHVSHMVGRDTAGLDEPGVVRAAVESLAENANDGVVAPIFYAFLGGAPLALAYKMVNTLDSMIGYGNERYRDFGWAAARLDDLAGFVPARITALAVAAASPLMSGDTLGALLAWRRDARGHKSPNAGVCESAFAGSLGVQLGGKISYGGEPVVLPRMGAGNRAPERGDIGRAVSLMYGTAVAALAAGAAASRVFRKTRRGSNEAGRK